MDRVANKDCRSYVERKEEFNGSNLYARKIGKLYVVYSYGEHYPMYIFRKGWWYENGDKYSVSTSKHRGQARPYVGVPQNPDADFSEFIFKLLTTEDMKNIIRREKYGN
tara:strand:+ start:587 stop:913 length:327 start_codon:yes stop_codon:yes gene_type:complete